MDKSIKYYEVLMVRRNREFYRKYKLPVGYTIKPYEKGNKGRFGLGLSIVKKVTETYGYLVAGENMNDGVVFRVIKPKVKKTKKQSAKQR